MAQTWGTRPSELLRLSDGWEAFEVDEAVALGGTHLEAIMDEAEARAIRGKGDPGAARRRALEEALEVRRSPVRARRPKGRPRFRYDLTGPAPVVVKVED